MGPRLIWNLLDFAIFYSIGRVLSFKAFRAPVKDPLTVYMLNPSFTSNLEVVRLEVVKLSILCHPGSNPVYGAILKLSVKRFCHYQLLFMWLQTVG